MVRARETDTLIDDGHESGLFDILRAVWLPCSIFVFGAVVMNLIVFTLPKIAEDPARFTDVEISLCQSVCWVGWALASVTAMPLSDKVGRRRPILVLESVGLVALFISTRATVIWLYGSMLFVVGFCLPPANILSYLLAVESVPARLRPAITVATSVGFSLVIIAMAFICKESPNLSWRIETALWHCPLVLLCLLAPFFLKESPAFSSQTDGKSDLSDSLRQLARSPLLTCMCATAICWIACSVSFYGLSYSAGKLSDNLHLNMALLGFVDLVGCFAAGPLMQAFSPIPTQIGSFCVAFLSMIYCGLLAHGSAQVVSAALLGRFSIDVAFTTVYILIVDCFPQNCRSTAMGIANFSSRCASLAAPLCDLVPTRVSYPILGMMCLLAAVATLELRRAKETK